MAIVWMGTIFYASTDQFSAAHTSRFIEPFLRWVSAGRLTELQVQQIHFLIRKFAHLSEYAVLAMLTWNTARRSFGQSTYSKTHEHGWLPFALAFFVATLYAAGDEFHQSFVPSRTASVHDVMIDSAGAFLGLAILQGGRWIRRR